jgi:hypothetical protein
VLLLLFVGGVGVGVRFSGWILQSSILIQVILDSASNYPPRSPWL